MEVVGIRVVKGSLQRPLAERKLQTRSSHFVISTCPGYGAAAGYSYSGPARTAAGDGVTSHTGARDSGFVHGFVHGLTNVAV